MDKKGFSILKIILVILIIIVAYGLFFSESSDNKLRLNTDSHADCILECNKIQRDYTCIEKAVLYDEDKNRCDCIIMRCHTLRKFWK